jgi:hypothetical protein
MQRLLAVALMLFLVSAADAQTLTKRPVSQGEVTPAEMTERLEKAAVRTKVRAPVDTELGVANIAPRRARKREYFSQCWPCIANAADHTIVQRDCISFKRTDMIVVI